MGTRRDPARMFVLCFRGSVGHGSVDYMGLGRVINTVIAAQAQGLTHSEVITYSPVDCSLSHALSLSLYISHSLSLTFSLHLSLSRDSPLWKH